MKDKMARVLILEDDPAVGSELQRIFHEEGIQSEHFLGSSDALSNLHDLQPDLILVDLELGNESGMEVLRRLNKSGNEIPVAVMADEGSMETVVEALHLDAIDYIPKPLKKSHILDIIHQVVNQKKQSRERLYETTSKSFPIIGQSSAMVEVYKAIARVARTNTTVLITGESGAGKELVARAIHDQSGRYQNPFVAVNCGALSETLLESELFGHMKGAFTGAHQTHKGIFENAAGGTVFLDEITETSPAFQVKLLRVLQQRTIRPVGSGLEKPVDVRILSATNQKLETLLNSTFRSDLLYRISVINIHIPALRERADDIPLLAHHFLRRHNRRQKKNVALPPNIAQWMQLLPWHGNVRELENAIERAVTMNISGEIQTRDFEQFGLPLGKSAKATEADNESDETPGSIDEVTRNHILKVLRITGGSKLQAAKILGIARPSLYRMARRLGINLDEKNRKP